MENFNNSIKLDNKVHNIIMNPLNFVKQKYYLKKIFYGNYVKNIILPLENINSNIGNKNGVKNTGKNEKKLLASRIRSQGNCIRKAYQNFWNVKGLTFLTLTYALNETNISKCKKDLKNFFDNITKWFKNPKRAKYNQGEFKYLYTYEYQKRGAVHFHIILNKKIPNSIVLQYWKYGVNKNIKVRNGGNEDVIKYLAKYIVKEGGKAKSKNHYDLNVKAYQFSKTCTNPIIKKGILELSLDDLVMSLGDNTSFQTFGDNKGNLIGITTDSYRNLDKFTVYEKYVSADSKIFSNYVKNYDFNNKKRF